jgi:hypothetical protein
MVRPEGPGSAPTGARPGPSCIELAGASPARVSAGAPGSRLPPIACEITPAKRSVESPLERGATKRAATSRQACSLVRLSAERRMGWPSRSFRGEGNRQWMEPGDTATGRPRGRERSTLRQLDAEQERPSSAAARRGKDPTYKAKPKWRGAERESEGLVVPTKAGTTRWREGALLWSWVRQGIRTGAWR